MLATHAPPATGSSDSGDSATPSVSDTPLRTYEEYQELYGKAVPQTPLRAFEDYHDSNTGCYFSFDSFRIRWPVFGGLTDIMVIDDPTDASSTARPLRTAEGWHPAANAPVSYPPISATKISSDELDSRAELTLLDWCGRSEDCPRNDLPFDEAVRVPERCDCEFRYYAPEQVLVTNPDGGPVTVRDVVVAAVPYFNAHRDEIQRARSFGTDQLPEDTKCYVRVGFFGAMMFFRPKGPGAEEEEWRRRAERARELKERGYGYRDRLGQMVLQE